MKLYLDVSCLNRPFDDQRQARVRLESEAILFILEQVDADKWQYVASEMTVIEIDATEDAERRKRLTALLPSAEDIIELTEPIIQRAEQLHRHGFSTADATHLAAEESTGMVVFLDRKSA